MRVTVVQTDIEWARPEENARHAEKLIERAEKSDLYVLPEMWSTGFATEPFNIAEDDDRSLTWMQETALKHQAAISGSIAIKKSKGKEAEYMNRHYFVKPDGTYDYYDKHHLFTYGGENLHYQAGNSRTIVKYMDWRFILLTCYDLRFPQWCRYRGDFDCMIFAANWPTSRRHVWDILLQARSIENQCYVIGCNRVGTDPCCTYHGGSTVIDAKGKTLMKSENDDETTLTVDISKEELINFRNKFRVLDDRD